MTPPTEPHAHRLAAAPRRRPSAVGARAAAEAPARAPGGRVGFRVRTMAQRCVRCYRLYVDPALSTCPVDGAPLELAVPQSAPRQQPPPAAAAEPGPGAPSECDGDSQSSAVLLRAVNTAVGSLVGTTLDGRYRVESLIGEGGMGAVYRAVQTSVRRAVAIKVLDGRVKQDVSRRFLNEARATSSLRGVHTVTIHDFGRSPEGVLYIVMELLVGESLEARLARGPLPWRTAAKIVAEVAESLHEAHGRGIVHRDLKPSNIHLVRMGQDADFVKVIDFGIAKIRGSLDASLTQHGHFLGTPTYAAPEQATTFSVTPASDLYALGVVLYEMLAGRPPFPGDDGIEALRAHIKDPPPPLDEVRPGIDVPPALRVLLGRLLEKSPVRRIGSAALVRDEAEAALADDGPGATEPAAPRSRPLREGQVEPEVAAAPWSPGPSAEEPAPQAAPPPRGADGAAAPEADPPRRRRVRPHVVLLTALLSALFGLLVGVLGLPEADSGASDARRTIRLVKEVAARQGEPTALPALKPPAALRRW